MATARRAPRSAPPRASRSSPSRRSRGRPVRPRRSTGRCRSRRARARDATAERLDPFQQRPVRVDRDARQPLGQLALLAVRGHGPAEQLAAAATARRTRRPACGARSRAASMPSAAAIVVLPTPPLPVTTTSLRSRISCIGPQSVSNRGPPAVPTIVPMSAQPAAIDDLLHFDERGLVPCVVQDWGSGEVLTLAYMNARGAAAAPARPASSTSGAARAAELWHKGESSGNVQAVRALRTDCDGDTVLALVEPGRARLPHRRADLLSPRRARAGRAPRGAARTRANARRAGARASRGLLHGRAAGESGPDRREGDGGGRGGQPRRP